LVVPELPKEVPEHRRTPMHLHSHPTPAFRSQQARTSQHSAPDQLLFAASAVVSRLLEDHVFHVADRLASAEVAQDSTFRVPPALVAEASLVAACLEGVEASSVAAALVVEAGEVPLDQVVKVRREAMTAVQVAMRSA
jgi:hypothetical protein